MKERITAMTEELGGTWMYNHVKRVLRLAEAVGEGMEYDREALWYGVYLHDWGACPQYNPEKIEQDHGLRSRLAAEKLLADSSLSLETREKIFEGVEYHDYRTDGSSIRHLESRLLREGDFLDFLGVIGIAREFARGPKDLKACLANTLARRDGVIQQFTLAKARGLAEQRLMVMEDVLCKLEEESFGYL